MPERLFSREVMKPVKSASDGSNPAKVDTDRLASLLKDSLPPDGVGDKRASPNSKAAEDHGDSAVRGAAASGAVSSKGPTKTVTTERHRVVTDEIGYDAPREDTTSTSFEAHVRMRIARPRVPENKAVVASPPRAAVKKAAHRHAEGAEASTRQRHRSSSSRRSAASPGAACSLCPDCGGGGGAVVEEAAGDERSCDCERGCCCCCRGGEASFSSCSSGECSSVEEDVSSPSSPHGEEDQWYSAASVSSRSTCSGCQTPEIGPLLHTTAAFCQSLARALSGEHQGNKRRC